MGRGRIPDSPDGIMISTEEEARLDNILSNAASQRDAIRRLEDVLDEDDPQLKDLLEAKARFERSLKKAQKIKRNFGRGNR